MLLLFLGTVHFAYLKHKFSEKYCRNYSKRAFMWFYVISRVFMFPNYCLWKLKCHFHRRFILDRSLIQKVNFYLHAITLLLPLHFIHFHFHFHFHFGFRRLSTKSVPNFCLGILLQGNDF